MSLSMSGNPEPSSAQSALTVVKWSLLGVLLVSSTLLAGTRIAIFPHISPLIDAVSLCGFSLIHCTQRYGLRSTLIFFGITYAISCSLEAISIHYGFPFSLYSYVNVPPPKILGVPVATGAVYFGTGYLAWMLAQLLLDRARGSLTGGWVIAVPSVAMFLIVMWDFCIDPINSTVLSLWVWPHGGSYFGVPIANYAGWFLTAYCIFQSFALYIGRRDAKAQVTIRPRFWYEVIIAYALQGYVFLLFPVSHVDHLSLYRSMALASVMTMFFVVLLACFAVGRIVERPS